MTRKKLPGNYVRSVNGVVAYVKVSTPKVTGKGRSRKTVQMVRLQFLGSGVTGQPMPLSILMEPGVKWFKNKPRKITTALRAKVRA